MNRLSTKKFRLNKSLATSVIAAGILSLAVSSQTTPAAFTSSAATTVLASAQKWIVDSLSFTQQEYSEATVEWTSLPEYRDYILQWSKTNNFTDAPSVRVTGDSYKVENLDASTNYYFRIQAIDAPGAGSSTTVIRTIDPKLSINSSKDIIAFDSNGELWNYGPAGTNTALRRSIAPAGTPIPNSFHVTDWNGDKVLDLVMNTKDGMLEVWAGRPEGGFTVRNIGFGGWDTYNISIGMWKNSDKFPSIVGMHKPTGNVYHYPNPTGAGHGVKTMLGKDWQNVETSIVDYDLDGNMDVLAKFPTGELKLYRSNGNSEFIAETRLTISTDWASMDSMRVAYGVEGPGTRGVVSREIATGDLYYTPIGFSSIGESWKFASGFIGHRLAGN